MTVQRRNSEMVNLLSADFQPRYEPNFAWKSAVSAFLALPALRAFWPMSSGDYTAANQGRDVSGSGYHLANNNSADFGYDNLAPYVEFDGANQFLDRADGGAGNWADILGTEAYVVTTQRGLTMGGWFNRDDTGGGGNEGLMGKWDTTANQRAYLLYLPTPVGTNPYFSISTNGIAVANAISTASMVNDTWHFVVGRFSPQAGPAQLDVWLDSTQTTNAVAIPAAVNDSTAAFEISGLNAGLAASMFNGFASMCFLCAAALSDAQVFSLFEQTRAMYGV